MFLTVIKEDRYFPSKHAKFKGAVSSYAVLVLYIRCTDPSMMSIVNTC